MPRQPKPFLRKQTRSWYCSINGRQISLGKSKKVYRKYQVKNCITTQRTAKKASNHILGLFAVGSGAEPYQEQGNDDDLIKFVLAELDSLFEGQASRNYVKHIFHDWNKEPYIQGAYSSDHESSLRAKILGQSVTKDFFCW